LVYVPPKVDVELVLEMVVAVGVIVVEVVGLDDLFVDKEDF